MVQGRLGRRGGLEPPGLSVPCSGASLQRACLECRGSWRKELGSRPHLPSPSRKLCLARGSEAGQLQLQPRNPESLAWGRVTWAASPPCPLPEAATQPALRLLLPSCGPGRQARPSRPPACRGGLSSLPPWHGPAAGGMISRWRFHLVLPGPRGCPCCGGLDGLARCPLAKRGSLAPCRKGPAPGLLESLGYRLGHPLWWTWVGCPGWGGLAAPGPSPGGGLR